MGKFLDEFGSKLSKPREAFEGKLLLLYFSAHWCPPCRQFTPQLAQWYKAQILLGKNIEIIFVSADKSAPEMQEYFSSMPWQALRYEHRDAQAALSQRYGVSGIPCGVVIGRDGQVLDKNLVQSGLLNNIPVLDSYIDAQFPSDRYSPGATVLIDGLAGAPQHNGKLGTITGFVKEKGRHYVKLQDATNEVLALKPANLFQRPRAKISGSGYDTSLNGKMCDIVSLDSASGKFTVEVDGARKEVESSNLVFAADTLVTTRGLKQEQFNGFEATIRSFDADAGRYVVQTSSKVMKLKPENLEVARLQLVN